MSKARRSFSASEKLSIINEADQFGVTQTFRKHNLSHSVFRRWKENFNVGGVSNLQSYTKRRNNVQREAVERFEFESIYHAQMIFNRYYEWYNNHRKHGYLGRKSPEQYLRENGLISGPYTTE